MILTLDEIVDINQNAEFDSAIGYARKIESAVLEKLKAQEPDKTKIECVTGAIYNHVSGELYPREVIAAAQYIVHRYCTTLPPADVVRDAERYRWLRERMDTKDISIFEMRKVYGVEEWNENIDAAIDAAMKEMK